VLIIGVISVCLVLLLHVRAVNGVLLVVLKRRKLIALSLFQRGVDDGLCS